MTRLISPRTGAPLQPRGEHILGDADGRLWPVVDGIPYLRCGRDALVAAAVRHIEAGDPDGALVALLADQDDWWSGPVPAAAALRALVQGRRQLSLREAMAHLEYGRVGDYFAHRWSDPTYLAGLALLDAHWKPTSNAYELACGIGHYLRELDRHGAAVTGGDVVFSKLWLARHWVVGPGARLVCFDAGTAHWPIEGSRFDLVFCHDALYFLPRPDEVVRRLRERVKTGGRLVVGHVHNRDIDNVSAGQGLSAAELARLFPDGRFYDDAELTCALAEGRAPRAAAPNALTQVEAFAVEEGVSGDEGATSGGLAVPPPGATLRLNPLYADVDGKLVVRWPSERYRSEYAAHATYPSSLDAAPPDASSPVSVREEAMRRRVLVELPQRW